MSLSDRPCPFYGLQLTILLMEEKRVEADRRKFTRLLPKDSTFAVLRPDFTLLGKVKDISEGGLAFQYISRERRNTGSSEIDIFVPGDSFYLPKVPSKTIYDTEIVEEYQILPDGMERRRCGLQFGDLTGDQRAKLDFFLTNHTTGTA